MRNARSGWIPIVALTAHVLVEHKEQCLQAGMDDYLSKPVRFEQIKEMLERWLPDEADLAC